MHQLAPYLCALLAAVSAAPVAAAPDPPAGRPAAASSGALEEIPMSSQHWEVVAQSHEFAEHLGREALRLQGGSARLPGVDIASGVVEFDIAFGTARGFTGLLFHLQDADNFEQFYFRPHQSGNPDASQYQPVHNGHSAWQICYGPAFAAPLVHRFDAWQHVRIVIAEDGADVFVDSEVPVLSIRPLLREETHGGIALQASGFAPAWFSNVRVQAAEAVPLVEVAARETEVPAGAITSWEVSSAFDEAALDGRPDLGAIAPYHRTLRASVAGITNLAEDSAGGGARTVIARARFHADEPARVPLELGYSDRAVVFLNGQPLFRGDQGYRRQDYRFLGTVGLYDTVFLPLRTGDNELAVAVSEDFGGWAIAARTAPTPGVRLLEPR